MTSFPRNGSLTAEVALVNQGILLLIKSLNFLPGILRVLEVMNLLYLCLMQILYHCQKLWVVLPYKCSELL